ncbi:MAG TPA: Gfo/Idh/MocA family oxidoreductase [Syntrophales bacterium]|nr:Gfo/Idh/MocA family oxidoreductase [Syntrophales bacterium]HQN78077.1 Gfo/Idh/MocA family oxidoreductase [Syntrophales bacterium]
MIRMGVIGYGYWGPNIVRNFSNAEGAEVVAICDNHPNARTKAARAWPGMKVYDDCDRLIQAPDVDAVAVVTPVYSYYELARKVLENGKHVFVEKPFTSSVRQAEELIELAERKNLKIMVDHTFLFTGAVRKIKELINERALGKLYYFDSTRVNLGLFQHDVNVIWDLAPHDLAIMDYLIGEQPEAISATGQSHLNGKEDIAFITLYFKNQFIAHFNVNWLSPVKIRQTLISGDKKMLVWNDLDADQKIKIYDKGVDVTSRESIYELLVRYRSGDVWIPRIDGAEALQVEAGYFIRCIQNGEKPMNDGNAGLRVVRILEATNQSLKNRGELIHV